MIIQTLDKIEAMTEHPDITLGEVMVSLSALYEAYGEAGENEKYSTGQHKYEAYKEWAEHADNVIQDILRTAKVIK